MLSKISKLSIESLEFRDLSFQHEPGVDIFRNLNAKFPLNEVVRIVGGAGSGKTALFKILVGLYNPTSGGYLINGKDISAMSFEEFLPYRLKIGYSFDYAGLINNMTLHENLMLPLLYHKVMEPNDAHKEVENMLERFALSHISRLRPSAVTGGARKATVVARAFILRPEVVFLDDPLTGLGGEGLRAFRALLDERRREGSLKHVFVTSQDNDILDELISRVVEVGSKDIRLWEPIEEAEVKSS